MPSFHTLGHLNQISFTFKSYQREARCLGQRKKLFVSCNSLKRNRVGRSALCFWSKMCVLCMFYVDWELGGRKKL